MEIQWKVKDFFQLSVEECYQLLQLRQDVFVLEQECLYPDIDGRDDKAVHVLGYDGNQLIAYTRFFAHDPHYQTASFGRVIIKESHRHLKLGSVLISKTIEAMENRLGKVAITISAQHHLIAFYGRNGFEPIGEPYDEDGIPHIRMVRK
ncbi:MAG: GNAT family N-acetyltransferase [Capnocytophaga sp.]|nr:GNAT family N-acetyltransferase [Capnocytophaga sp.]